MVDHIELPVLNNSNAAASNPQHEDSVFAFASTSTSTTTSPGLSRVSSGFIAFEKVDASDPTGTPSNLPDKAFSLQPTSIHDDPVPSIIEINQSHFENSTQESWASALPPTDKGRKAWSFLVAATMIEMLVWGLPFSVGILHVYWVNTLFGPGSEATVTLAATLQTGLLYMSAGAFGPMCAAFPRLQKHIQIVGLISASVSLIGTAFATKPWHLILSFGCIYPFAGALYLPCATLLFEWFHTRRGLAAGIMYAGTGAGGTVFPFIVTALLNKLGYRTAMISLGVAYGIIGSICLIFIERRIPLSRKIQPRGRRRSARDHERPKMDWSFVSRRTMGFGILTILMTSLGNFVPSLWIPTFADELMLTNPSGVGLIAIMNAASVPGNALLGYLSDHLPLHYVILVSCLGSGISCLLLWGFGTNSALLVVFALCFGMLGLSFTGLWSRMISIISRDDPTAPTLVWSIFTFVRGVGNVTSGPISEALLRVDAFKGAPGIYGFKNYGVLLLYTGLAISSGSLTGWVFHG